MTNTSTTCWINTSKSIHLFLSPFIHPLSIHSSIQAPIYHADWIGLLLEMFSPDGLWDQKCSFIRMKGLGGLKRQLRDFICSVDPMPPCLPIDPKSGMVVWVKLGTRANLTSWTMDVNKAVGKRISGNWGQVEVLSKSLPQLSSKVEGFTRFHVFSRVGPMQLIATPTIRV